MAKFASTYPGTLILPTGEEIASGGTADIPDALAKNAGVLEWIESGWLAKSGRAEAPRPE